jgi:predicted O-methyltransferase YrrM
VSTIVGLKPYGYFLHYKYASGAPPLPYPALEPYFAASTPAFRPLLAAMDRYGPDMRRFETIPNGPYWLGMFPPLDAAAAYTIVRETKPQQIVEIGSGYSTSFLAQAVIDGGLTTKITCIDPQPRAKLAHLPVTHLKSRFEMVDQSIFASLRAGDIVFIDSSHIGMPGTDVDRLFLDVMPRLEPGVLVHVHDIFLPDTYPEDWTRRAYNEQMLIGMLIQGRGWEIIFPSFYIWTRHRAELDAIDLSRMDFGRDPSGGSIWLRKA